MLNIRHRKYLEEPLLKIRTTNSWVRYYSLGFERFQVLPDSSNEPCTFLLLVSTSFGSVVENCQGSLSGLFLPSKAEAHEVFTSEGKARG
jgi:hypothetical protein